MFSSCVNVLLPFNSKLRDIGIEIITIVFSISKRAYHKSDIQRKSETRVRMDFRRHTN